MLTRLITGRKTIVAMAALSFLFIGSLYADESFEKRKLRLGNKTLIVEIADTPARRAQGLMNRKSLPKDHGMLFIFDNEERQSFWMKNTLISLSIAFFDENRKLLEIQDMEPASMVDQNPKIYASTKPAKYALEVPKGWFAKNKIAKEMKFELFSGR